MGHKSHLEAACTGCTLCHIQPRLEGFSPLRLRCVYLLLLLDGCDQCPCQSNNPTVPIFHQPGEVSSTFKQVVKFLRGSSYILDHAAPKGKLLH